MKRIVSLLLAGVMMVSAVPVTFAADTNGHSQGTQVVYTAENNESYTITVPAGLNPGQSGTVTLSGTWPGYRTVTVTADKSVTLKNSIKATDTKTLNVTFPGISKAGSNIAPQTFTETVSVAGISDALFGNWSGKFNYNVTTTGEEAPPSENYVGTVSADNTITLSGVETAGTYTLRYANANGALENYADICSLEVTDPATAVSYNDLIAENCAPVEATSIAVYNAADKKVGDIALGGLKPNLGTKLYSFGALADTHIGADDSNTTDFIRALTYFNDVENVSFIIDGGDLTEYGTADEFIQLRNLADTYSSAPVYVTAGNHDPQGDVNMLTEFETYAGNAPYFSFTHGNDVYILVGINYFQEDSSWTITKAELQWLYETLESNRDKRCFVFEHMYLDNGSGDPDNKLSYGNLLQDKEKTILTSLFSHYSNVIFMHGHSHFAFDSQQENAMANYDNNLGTHSIHIPALGMPRKVTDDGAMEYMPSKSEGYVVDVYENGIVLRGREFADEKFLPIAQYALDTSIKTVEAGAYTDSTNTLDTSGITNKLPYATDMDGNIYNGIGYKANTRISTSSGSIQDRDEAPWYATGFIPVTATDFVQLQNCIMKDDDVNDKYGRVSIYFADANKNYISGAGASDLVGYDTTTIDSDGNITSFRVWSNPSIAYVRIVCQYLDENSIITVKK